MKDQFWLSSDKEREQGFSKEENTYKCMFCDFTTEIGIIYPHGEVFADGRKTMEIHIQEEHGGVFNYLLEFDKKVIGFSEQQKNIIKMFYEGLSDNEVKDQLGIGSVSTVRNHRYTLKEKEKQAKCMVTIMSLLSKVTDESKEYIRPHKTAKMLDKRYDITNKEYEKVLEKYFPDGVEARLKTFSMKEKNKIVVLTEISKRFQAGRIYSEKDVDVILKEVYPDDHVVIRRYLIQYGFMDRRKDCSEYWIKSEKDKMNMNENTSVDKKRLIQEYKAKVMNEKVKSGVYQIKNNENGKVFIGSARNIEKLNGLSFQLNMGTFPNKSLQKDWKDYGSDKFTIEVIDTFEEDENKSKVMKKLREMEVKWKEKLEETETNFV